MARIHNQYRNRARKILNEIKFLGVALLLFGYTVPSVQGQINNNKKKKHKTFTKKDQAKLKTHRKAQVNLATVFGSKAHRVKAQCPNYLKTGKNEDLAKNKAELENNHGPTSKKAASLSAHSEIMEFDIIEVGEKRLNIPEFKQFKNNRSEFTEDGNEQFNSIITQLQEYLGEESTGKGLTLRIKGSASQIPTSYHPNKENFGINADGSSIKGQTNIENNIYLAQARAMELAYRIKEIYPYIEVITPEFTDIQLGVTKWDYNTQKALDKAHLAGNNEGKVKVFEPFQKEQYVLVESKDLFIKTIEPNAIRTYTVSAVPRLKLNQNGEQIEVKGRLIISEKTYKILKASHNKFQNISKREQFMNENNLKIVQVDNRWHMISNKEEELALKINDMDTRLTELYNLNMNHNADYNHITKLVKEDHLKKNKYKYVIKSGGITSNND